MTQEMQDQQSLTKGRSQHTLQQQQQQQQQMSEQSAIVPYRQGLQH
jgi:hypothetical protein